MSIESVMPSNHLILCRPLLLLTSIFSSIRVRSEVSEHDSLTTVPVSQDCFGNLESFGSIYKIIFSNFVKYSLAILIGTALTL